MFRGSNSWCCLPPPLVQQTPWCKKTAIHKRCTLDFDKEGGRYNKKNVPCDLRRALGGQKVVRSK